MNEYLPEIKYRDGIKRSRQTGFGGLDRRAAAGDGSIRFMRNMTTDHYPLMGARAERTGYKIAMSDTIKPTGFYCWNERFIVSYETDSCTLDGCPCEEGVSHGHILLDGEPVNDSSGHPATLEATGEKRISHIGNYVCFWPDKVFLKFPEEGYENDLVISNIGGFKFTDERITGQGSAETGDSNRFTRLDIYMDDQYASERNKLYQLNQGDTVTLSFDNKELPFKIKSAFQVYNVLDDFFPIGRIGVYEEFHELLEGYTISKLNATDYYTFGGGSITITRRSKDYVFGSMELFGRFSGVSYTSGVDENGMQGTLNRFRALMYSDIDDISKFSDIEPEYDFKADDVICVSPQNFGGDATDEYTSEHSYIIRKAEKTLVNSNSVRSDASGSYSFIRYDFYLDDFVLPKKISASRMQSFPGSGHGAPLFLVERRIPDLEGVFLHNNRLWGWKDDTIYCSGLGQPFNWYNYELSTGAWTVSTGTPGKITAGCSYLGNPIFFKEDRLFKVYGEYPAQFRLSQVSVPGVREGGAKSLAICGRLLTYAGPDGIYQYAGSNSVNRISDTLGRHRANFYPSVADGSEGHRRDYEDVFSFPFKMGVNFYFDGFMDVVACSDGRKYYINLYVYNGFRRRNNSDMRPAFSLLCYDSYTGAWTVDEESCLLIDSVTAGDLYVLMRHNCKGSAMTAPDNGVLWEQHNQSDYRLVRMSYYYEEPSGYKAFFTNASEKRDALLPDGAVDEDAEGKISEAVFNDFSNGMAEKKGVSRIDFVALGNGSVTPFISWDGGAWQKLRDAVNVEGKKCFISTVVPRRTGVFRLKFIGTGEWMISNLEIEYYNGTDLQEK
jgi:hypothetical protein